MGGYFRRRVAEIEARWKKNVPDIDPETLPEDVKDGLKALDYDPNNIHYFLPLICLQVKATRKWGYIVCLIETIFIVFCLLLNLIHFGIFLPQVRLITFIPYCVFAVTLIEIGTFVAVKIDVVRALRNENDAVLRFNAHFQYATAIVGFVNCMFTFAVFSGGSDAFRYYATYEDTILIEVIAWMTVLFLPVQIYLRWCHVCVVRRIEDRNYFRRQVVQLRYEYRKKCFFTIASIRYSDVLRDTIEKKKKKLENADYVHRPVVRAAQGVTQNNCPSTLETEPVVQLQTMRKFTTRW